MPPIFAMSDNSSAAYAAGMDLQRPIIAAQERTIGVTETIWLSLSVAVYLAVICGCTIVQRIIKPR